MLSSLVKLKIDTKYRYVKKFNVHINRNVHDRPVSLSGRQQRRKKFDIPEYFNFMLAN